MPPAHRARRRPRQLPAFIGAPFVDIDGRRRSFSRPPAHTHRNAFHSDPLPDSTRRPHDVSHVCIPTRMLPNVSVSSSLTRHNISVSFMASLPNNPPRNDASRDTRRSLPKAKRRDGLSNTLHSASPQTSTESAPRTVSQVNPKKNGPSHVTRRHIKFDFTDLTRSNSRSAVDNRRKARNSEHGRSAILGSAIVLVSGTERQKREFITLLRTGECSITIEQFNEVLSTLSRLRRFREAAVLAQLWEQEPFSTMLRNASSVKSYTIMIDVYGRSYQLARAFSLFYGMRRAGPSPNVITYNAMIAACARNNEPDMAYEVFEEMQANGMKPDKFTYGSLIDSCAKSGQVERAFQISQLMDMSGVVKDQTIYSALMDACGRAKQLERAFLVYEEMKRNAVWPNLITFSVLIDTCANARQPERAFQLFSEIKHWGFPRANVVVYTALIDACSKAGWPERAELVMKSMIDSGIRPNEISYGALMDGWTKEGQITRAFEIVERMVRQHNVQPNAVLIGGLIDACRRNNEPFRAKAIWAVVMKFNIRPSRTYYPPLLAMAARSGDIDVASAIALHAYARGLLRRVALNSEDPTLHALACAIVYLKHAVENNSTCDDELKKQHFDRLRLVFSSTAMNADQLIQLSPDVAYECSTSWSDSETNAMPHEPKRARSNHERSNANRRRSAQGMRPARSKKHQGVFRHSRNDFASTTGSSV